MPEVMILRCRGCGAGLPPRTETCEYCQSRNVVSTLVPEAANPFTIKDDLAHLCAVHYQKAVRDNPSDFASHYALGLFHLRLRLYDLAGQSLRKAIDVSPGESGPYYYYALSLVRGRRPRTLGHREATEVSSYLSSARALGDTAHYCYFAALLADDYYAANGLRNSGQSYEDCMSRARVLPHDPVEIEMLCRSVQLPDHHQLRTLLSPLSG